MHWLSDNWRAMLPSPWLEILLALAAAGCGGIVGTERWKREKPAGLRTLVLVSVGSAAFTMVSFVFSSSTRDSGRVAAQIVTGIGFLGAGVIMRERGAISGMTTAAAIWVTASIGMVAGAGYAGGALGLSLLARTLLTGIFLWESRNLEKIPPVTVSLDFDPDNGKTRIRLARTLSDFNIPSGAENWSHAVGKNGLDRLTLCLHLQQRHLREMLDAMIREQAVESVHGFPESAMD